MLLWVILPISLAFAAGAVMGAPYLPILKRDHDALLDLCNLKPGQVLLDLGSGDGRLLKAAARRGYHSIGYEINPILYLISKVATWPERHLITVHLGDYWHTELPASDAIYVFLIDRYMAKLAAKLDQEITRPTTVVSYIFAIPNRTPIHTIRNAFVYVYGHK